MFPPPPFPPPPCIHPSPPLSPSPHLNAFRLLAECVGIVQEPHHHVTPPPVYPRPLPTPYHALTLTPSVSLQSV